MPFPKTSGGAWVHSSATSNKSTPISNVPPRIMTLGSSSAKRMGNTFVALLPGSRWMARWSSFSLRIFCTYLGRSIYRSQKAQPNRQHSEFQPLPVGKRKKERLQFPPAAESPFHRMHPGWYVTRYHAFV